MRVIGGEKRGTKLFSLEGNDTRPTTDRVKESLFNIIQWEIRDKKVLDLFAGSGGLGIEALSRGASYAVFVDGNEDAVKIIRKNIEKLRYEEKCSILYADYKKVLNNIQNYDIIFLDPPYKSDLIEKSLHLILTNKLLSQDGIVICETEKNRQFQYNGFFMKKEVCYGITKLCFLKQED